MQDEMTTIEGILKRVSDPRSSTGYNGKGRADYFKFGIKTDDGKRILATLNTRSLGWSGNLRDSIIWYRRQDEDRDVKISLANPDRYVGQRLLITGILTSIDRSEKKYKLSSIQEVVLFLEE